jgi:hypothetical protein
MPVYSFFGGLHRLVEPRSFLGFDVLLDPVPGQPGQYQRAQQNDVSRRRAA